MQVVYNLTHVARPKGAFVSEELKIIISFVEGDITAKELERCFHANPSGFEEALNNDPNLPVGHLDQGVYLFIIQQNMNYIADVHNVYAELQNYLFRNAIACDGREGYSRLFGDLLSAQPDWLNVLESEYFLKQVLPDAVDRSGEGLKYWVQDQLLERFRYANEPPNWIQGADWPINQGGPLVFLGEVKAGNYFHDEAMAYVFYDEASATCETVLQVA